VKQVSIPAIQVRRNQDSRPCPGRKTRELITAEPSVEQSVEQSQGLRYLSADEYRQWDELVEASPQGSLFCRSWWLKVAALISVFWDTSIVADLLPAFPCFSRSELASSFAQCRV